jgi:hypothetical protein
MLSGEGNVKIRILVRLGLERLGVITRELTATAVESVAGQEPEA